MITNDIAYVKPFIDYLSEECGKTGKIVNLLLSIYRKSSKYRTLLDYDTFKIRNLKSFWVSFMNHEVISRLNNEKQSYIICADSKGYKISEGIYIREAPGRAEYSVVIDSMDCDKLIIGNLHLINNEYPIFIPSIINGMNKESGTTITYLFPSGLVVNTGNAHARDIIGFEDLLYSIFDHNPSITKAKFLNSSNTSFKGSPDAGELFEAFTRSEFMSCISRDYNLNTQCCFIIKNDLYGISKTVSENIDFNRLINKVLGYSLCNVRINEDNLKVIMQAVFDGRW